MKSHDRQIERILRLWRDRRRLMLIDYEKGMTFEMVGAKWKVSKQRAHMIIKTARKERDGENTEKRD